MSQSYEFYLEGTNGKGVLLVHGLTGTPAEMRFLGKSLHKKGYTVYCPVLTGHCEDAKAVIKTTWQDWIAGLQESLHKFPEDMTVYTAGICVGGALGLYLAHKNPQRIKASAWYAAALSYDGWNMPWFSSLPPQVFLMLMKLPVIGNINFSEKPPYGVKNERVRNAIMKPENLNGALPHFPLRALKHNYLLNLSLVKDLPAIKTPTILIHAREDDVSHLRNSEKIKSLIGGPCELVVLEDSYHMVHIDQQRQLVADSTANFFEKY